MFNIEHLINLEKFSSWPSQSINKNESELLLFSKYFDIIDKEAVQSQMLQTPNIEERGIKIRNVDKANNKRSTGNMLYKENNSKLAAKYFTDSILYVPRDSKEFALAIANRSAALFDMEKYKECLQDINIAINSEYPEELKYKIFLRQGKCYLKLNMNLEAAKSIRKAEENVDKSKLSETRISVIKEEIAEMKSQLEEQLRTNNVTDVPNDNVNNDIILLEPNLKNRNNPKFLNAAQVVDFKYNKKFGRHVVANTDINKGDVLFIEEPYSYIDWKQISFRCSFCLQKVLNGIPCIECPWYMYCSDECRISDWNSGHQWICVAEHRKVILDPVHILSLKILFKASYEGFQTTIEDDSIYGQENNYPFVDKLLTNKNSIPEDLLQNLTKEAVWMILYLKNYTKYFNWLYVQPNRPEGCKEELYKFIGGQLLKYLLQIQSNAVYILERSVHFDPKIIGYIVPKKIGLGIYISTALLNHSCLPNAIQIFDGKKTIIRAKDYIKKGTEVTVNYLVNKFYVMEKTEDRQDLLKKYVFTCTCPGCTDSTKSELFTVLLCPLCNGRAFQKDPKYPALIECNDCNMLTMTPVHLMMLDRIERMLHKGLAHEDYSDLDTLQKLMEQFIHKQNMMYFSYYTLRLHAYNETGEINKCLEIAKLNMEQMEANMGDVYNVPLLLTYTYFLIKYCLTLTKKNSKAYKKNMGLAEKHIKKSALLLQYHTSKKIIEKYVAKMMKYLNTGHIDMKYMDMERVE